MNKKNVCILLAALLLMVLLPWNDAAAQETASGALSETVSWKLEDGTLTISGEGKMEGMSSSHYPPWYYLREQITAVVVEEGITTVGALAFADCVNLTQVQLPATVLSLYDRCFKNCESLTGIELPSKLTRLGNGVFEGCKSLKSIVLPNTLKDHVGERVFQNCTSLESVTLSSKMKEVTYYMFQGCKSLKEITLPKSITGIRQSAFRYCKNLTKVEIKGELTFIGGFAFEACTSLEVIDLPASLETIGDYAFQSCRGLKEIWFRGDLPDKIGFQALYLTQPEKDGCTIYYPVNNKTWTKEMIEKYDSYEDIRLEPYGTPECDHDVVVVPGKEATCTEEGLTEGKYCSICEKVLKKQKTVEALGHDLVTTTVPPACTEPGYDLHQCSRCEYSETDNPVEAAGHAFGQWETMKEPTVEETGLSLRVCTVCGETEQQELEKLTPPPTQPPTQAPTTPVTIPAETGPAPTQPAAPAPQERMEAGLWIALILAAVVGAIVAVKLLTKKKM